MRSSGMPDDNLIDFWWWAGRATASVVPLQMDRNRFLGKVQLAQELLVSGIVSK
jgi:hypothetical protein